MLPSKTVICCLSLLAAGAIRAADSTDPSWTAGSDATVASGDTVTLTKSTAALNSLTVSGTLTLTNWETCVQATTITVRKGGTVTCGGPVTNEAALCRVYLKCADLVVEAGGKVDVAGKGWSGGFLKTEHPTGYGPGALQLTAANAAGSHGGIGSFNASGNARELSSVSVYGSASEPVTAGSGGAGGRMSTSSEVGGAGGGVIRLEVSNHADVSGTVSADGKSGFGADWGSGAGGSVYINCNTFGGAHGRVTADGGQAASHYSSWGSRSGGGGRVAIIFNKSAQEAKGVPTDMRYSADCGPYHRESQTSFPQAQQGSLHFSSDTLIDRRGATLFGRLQIGDVPSTGWVLDSFRLTNGWAKLLNDKLKMHVTGNFEVTGKTLVRRRVYGDEYGETVAEQSGTRWDVGGSTVYYATNICPCYTVSAIPPQLEVDGNLTVSSNAVLYAYSAKTPLYQGVTEIAKTNVGAKITVGGQLKLTESAKVYCESHPWSGASPVLTLGSFSMDASSYMTADDLGYFGGYYNNAYPGVNNACDSPSWPTTKCGASHGGLGGWCSSSTTAMGPVFDSAAWPTLPGPGGHGDYSGGSRGYRGGGVLRLHVTGDAVVEGRLSANCTVIGGFTGTGAGGTVSLACRTLTGSGKLSATGANGYCYASSSTVSSGHHGGAGGGGRIAVHYDSEAQGGVSCGIGFEAQGGNGVGDGVLTGNGGAGSLWFTDDTLIAGSTTFSYKGKIYCPDPLSHLTLPSLVLEDALLDLSEGGGLDVTGDIVVKGTSRSSCGINIAGGYLRCGGNFYVTNATISVSGGEPAQTNRLAVGGDFVLDNAPLTLTPVETESNSFATVGGTLTLTNASTITLQSPCHPVEGEPGLVFSAAGLVAYTNCWIYPWSHNTNGASVLLRIDRAKFASGAGIDAVGKGYGRLTGVGELYGPASTECDGRGTDGGDGPTAVAPGHGGTGGLKVSVGDVTYPKGRGQTYDKTAKPVYAGCGGTGSYQGSSHIPMRGGGVVRVESDVFDLNGGSLLASAATGWVSFRTGGSGGSVYLRANRFTGGGGRVEAKGGDGGDYDSGKSDSWCMSSGGGGRVAIWYGNVRNPEATNVTVSVAAGKCYLNASSYPAKAAERTGAAGTVFWQPCGGFSLIVR